MIFNFNYKLNLQQILDKVLKISYNGLINFKIKSEGGYGSKIIGRIKRTEA